MSYSMITATAGDPADQTVYHYLNAAAAVAKTENAMENGMMDGTLIATESYLNGHLENTFTAEYEFTDTINGKKIYGDVLAGGVLIKVTEIDEKGNGIKDITEFKADLISGARKELTTYNYSLNEALNCVKEVHQTRTQFAYEMNPEMARQHRFTEKSLITVSVNGRCVSEKEIAYGMVDGFLSEKKLICRSGDQQRQNELYEIVRRGKYGLITAKKGVFPEYFVFDQTGCYRIAEFTGAGEGEGFVYTFEEYEKAMVISGAGAEISDKTCRAGTRCLEIKPGCSSGRSRHRFLPSTDKYGFSFYAQGSAGGLIQITSGGKIFSEKIIVDHSEGKLTDAFSYNLVRLEDLSQGEADITFINNSDTALFVDILVFFPLMHPPQINIYYQGGALLAASVSGYGNISETVYDELGRVVYIVNNNKVIEASVPSLGRKSAAAVNSNFMLKNAKAGCFHKFLPAITVFTPEETLDNSFFVLFFCKREEIYIQVRIASGDTNIRCLGGVWSVDFDPHHIEPHFSITDKDFPTDKSPSAGDSLITLLFGDIIILAVDGQVIHSVRNPYITKQTHESCLPDRAGDPPGPVLKISGSTDITNLAVGSAPISSIVFSDGAGKLLQEQVYYGDKVAAAGKGYDRFGRLFAETLPVYLDDHYFRYHDNFITRIDEQTGEMTGLVADKNPDCKAYPYFSNIFENRDNGRNIEKGSPGRDYAANPGNDFDARHSLRTIYTHNQAAEILPDIFRNMPPYFSVITHLDPDQNRLMTLYDLQKNKVAEAAHVSGQWLLTRQSQEYDSNGRTVCVTLPRGNIRKRKQWFTSIRMPAGTITVK